MSITAGPRLRAAEALIARFAAAGRPAAGRNPAETAKRTAAQQASPVGWPFSRDALVQALRRRMSGKDLPKQMGTSYCGPAAFLYCVLEDRPDLYCAYAISMWLHGEYDFRSGAQIVEIDSNANTRKALPTARAAQPNRSFISDLDWMTMAPLSASTRPGWAKILGSPEPDDQVGSISYPGVVKGWFSAVGAQLRADTMGVGLMKTSPTATIGLMRHWANSWIVLQIDSSLIQAGGTNTFANRHWVVVNPHRRPLVRAGRTGQVVPLADAYRAVGPDTASDMDDWKTSLYTVSWGSENKGLKNPTLGHLKGRIYGGFAFSHF
jgi:hypothetical protein